MRELTLNEVEQVSGARWNWFTGEGEIFSAENIATATRFSAGLGMLYGSYEVGYQVGSWINNHYETQISNFVWNTFH